MLDDIIGFSNQLFLTAILLLAAGIASNTCHGLGTQRGRETFICLILLLIMGCQLYHLINASVYIPANRFFVFNEELHREDCINSDKGGKRPGKSQSTLYLNPCYCSYNNTCVEVATDAVYNGTSCPTGDEYECRNAFDIKVHKWVPRLRNCHGGQSKTCTLDSPCYPCELETLPSFQGGRCGSCSTDNPGHCNFILGIGPYCFLSPDSMTVVPCKSCCTSPTPLMVEGVCY